MSDEAGSPAAEPQVERRPWAIATTLLWCTLTAAILVLAAWSTRQRLTWYVATIQFSMLTFARDLLHGTVFHHAPALDALRDLLPPRTDALAQTYVWDHGRLYSRYAPGFPILLAVAMAVGGEDAAPYVNVVLFVVVLALLVAIGRRVLGSRWLGTAVPALVVLIPSRARWWALTATHDMAAHCFGILGVYLAMGRGDDRPYPASRAVGAGLALGYAVSIRPDTALYLIPAVSVAAMAVRRSDRHGATSLVAAATMGLLVGMAPFLAYNQVATGSALRPTQAMELSEFWNPTPSRYDVLATERGAVARSCAGPAWCGGTFTQVQGGGLRLSNLREVLAANLRGLRTIYGDTLLGLASVGTLLAVARRRRLFLTVVPYVITALIFYSCWTRPDRRLLLGVDLLLPMLILEGTVGTVDLVAAVAPRGRRTGVVILLLLVAVTSAMICLAPVAESWGTLPARGVDLGSTTAATLERLLFLSAMLAPVAALAWTPRTGRAVAAAVLVVGLVAMTSQESGLYRRAPFQQAEVEHARQTFGDVVPPPAVVITTEAIGRPAENIEYYTGIPTLYRTDLERWRLGMVDAARALIDHGMTPYLLIDEAEPDRSSIVADLSATVGLTAVRTIPPARAIEYFVAAPFGNRFPLQLYRLGRE